MKKRIIGLTIFLISFFTIFSVKAQSDYTAALVNENYEKYKNAVSGLSANNCEGTLYTNNVVNKCNSFGYEKSQSLTYLYNAREYDKNLISDEINKVLDANESSCSTIMSASLQNAIDKIFILMYIAGPILLILFGSIDLTTAIVAGDEKQRKAAYRKFVRRTIALVLLFAAPVLVNVLVNTFAAKKTAGSKYACNFKSYKVTISYVSRKKGKGNDQIAQRILEAAAEINRVSADGNWSYGCIGAGKVLSNYRNHAKGKNMCCADYVSAVLALAEVFTEDEINNMHKFNSENCGWGGYNTQASGVHAFLIKKDWIRVDKIEDLQPGDIVFTWPQFDYTPKCISATGSNRGGHVEIYAGDGKKYSGGYTPHINTMGPHKVNYSTSGEHRFIEAYRAPGTGTNKR